MEFFEFELSYWNKMNINSNFKLYSVKLSRNHDKLARISSYSDDLRQTFCMFELCRRNFYRRLLISILRDFAWGTTIAHLVGASFGIDEVWYGARIEVYFYSNRTLRQTANRYLLFTITRVCLQFVWVKPVEKFANSNKSLIGTDTNLKRTRFLFAKLDLQW